METFQILLWFGIVILDSSVLARTGGKLATDTSRTPRI